MLLPSIGIDPFFKIPHTPEDFKLIHHQPINMPNLPNAHQHDFYMILLIEKGGGTHTIDFKAHEVKDKMVFFLAPGQTHQWDLAADTSGYQLLFSTKFLLSGSQRFPYFNISAIPLLPLHDEQYLKLVNELEKAGEEAHNTQELYIDVLQNRLQIILLLLKRWYNEQFDEQEFSPENRIMNSFLALLEKQYAGHNEISFYAEKLSVTPAYLNQVCGMKAGITAADYIRERILLEAKRMLTFTRTDLKAIAHLLGFNDTAYFSRFFRKYTGTPPQEFRKKNN